MAENLTNRHIYETYHSLIKTGDNLPIDGTLKVLSDGDGNELPISVSEDTTKFKEESTVDFTDVTIIGGAGFQGAQGATGAQGPQGLNGSNGAQGSQGSNGSNGAQGSQGSQGPRGFQGFNGSNGAQGAQGQNGSNGAQGFQGQNGSNGAQGFQGQNGSNGAQGAQGINGVDGAQGAQGFQGPLSGIAINDTTPNTAHTGNVAETIIDTVLVPANSVSDGDVFNYLARISGSKAVSGTTLIRAYVNTSATIGGQALASTGAQIISTNFQQFFNRYFYVNKADGTGIGTQVWNASAPSELVTSPIGYVQSAIDWTVDQYIVLTGQLSNATNSVSCQGSTFANRGGKGLDGAQGPQGTQGPGVGAQGAQGPQGFQGTGVQGATGTQGAEGAQGVQGPLGPQGDLGAQGAQGPQGFQGTTGISSGATYYFNQSVPSDVSPYKQLSLNPLVGTQQEVTTSLTSLQQNVLVSQFLTPELGFGVIPGGIQRFHLHFLKQAEANDIEAYATIQLANSAGTAIGPILTTGNSLVGWVDSVVPAEVLLDLTLPTSTVDPTNRMIVKLYVSNYDNQVRTIDWYTEGTQYYSFIVTSVGVIGNQGPQGFQGSTGAQGVQGPLGPQGDTGAQGAQGPTNPDNITSSGPNTIANVWSGTQAQYDALGSYSATTLYFIE
jgi:hypothetical protein